MRAIQVKSANGPLELVEKPIPQPPSGWVRIKVEACGICHTDVLVKDGSFPVKYPRTPGHEAVGVIDELGPDVIGWTKGQRVGVGWFGGQCNHCPSCRRGDFMTCSNMLIPGISYDGGYAEYMIAPASALAKVPGDLSSVEAAPLMCAGITTFNALRNSGAKPGDLVVILGIGGLGHLAIQYAAKMGYKTVAIARGAEKEALAKELGAKYYIDETQNPSAALKKLGGAKVILSTITHTKPMSDLIDGLDTNGKLVIVGIGSEPLEVSPLALIGKRLSIVGWPSGTSNDSEDTLEFSTLANVRSMNEIYPLEKAAEAFDRMMSGKARFRVVLSML